MAKQSEIEPDRDDPRRQEHWTLVYNDSFDRDAPPSIEVTGTGLIPGLIELWGRFLYETVSTASTYRDGAHVEEPSLGFSRFHLELDRDRISIDGPLEGAVRLKRWIYGGAAHREATGFLRELALAHAASSSLADAPLALLDAAEAAADATAYLAELARMRARWSR